MAANTKKFTLDEVRKAFWAEFHKSGELWFNYFGTDQECDESTKGFWDDFKRRLCEQDRVES